MRSIQYPIASVTIGILILACLITSTPAARAQSATSCPLAPLTLPLFEAATPADVAATPVVSSDAPALDEDGAREAMEIIVSCSNSANPAVAYAIFTDRYLASLFSDPAETYLPAFEQQIAQGAVQPDRSLELEDIVSINVLPDGRVEVTATTAANGARFTDTFTLVWVDGAWLIDDVSVFNP